MSDRGIAIHYKSHNSTKRRTGAALAPRAGRDARAPVALVFGISSTEMFWPASSRDMSTQPDFGFLWHFLTVFILCLHII